MKINRTSKEMSTDDRNLAVDANNDLDFPSAQRPGKDFETHRAAFALKGYALYRTNPADGPVTYWIERSGVVRHSAAMHDLALFLAKVGQ